MRGAGLAATLRRHSAIAVLLAIAAVIYSQTRGAYGMLMWDEAQYASLARSLVRGEGYTIAGAPEPLRPPLLPLAGAASVWLAGRADDSAVHAAAVGLALLALALVYAGVARAYDRTTALATVALLGSAPWFWTSTANVLSEIPLLAFFAPALFCWSGGLLQDSRWFYASWFCLGLALLARYTALLFAPLALLLTLVELARGDAAVRQRVWSRSFLFAPLAGLLVVMPWLLHQTLEFGDPLVGFRQASTQLQVYLPGVSMPWWWYLADLPAMLSWPTVALMVCGAAWALRRNDRFAIHCLLVVAFILVWFSCYRYKEPRLVSAMLPAAALLAARGLTRGLLAPVPRTAVAAIVASIVLVNWQETRPVFAHVRVLGYPSFLDAMEFVREHSAPDALLVGPNSPQIFWYADRAVVDFPEPAALPALLERAAWVVVTNFERGQRPYVRPLAERLPRTALSDGSAVRFTGGRYTTLVVRGARLRELMSMPTLGDAEIGRTD